MKNKKERLSVISEILRFQVMGSQEELLDLLREKGYDVTQATLSRDLKVMKVAKNSKTFQGLHGPHEIHYPCHQIRCTLF